MATLIPFYPRRNRTREAAAYVLALSKRLERSSHDKSYHHPEHHARLGNLLQILIAKRPAVVFVIENIVVEMLAQLNEVP
jgi:hypothetical protein